MAHSDDTTNKVKEALDYVRGFFPTVTRVVYSADGRWNYTDENFNAPNFDGVIEDVSLLEEASDTVEILPAVFEFPLNQNQILGQSTII